MWYAVAILLAVLHSGISQSGEDCRCVSFTLCRENGGTIITDGEDLIDERIGPFCENCACTGIDICCSLGNESTRNITPRKVSKGCGLYNPDGVGFKSNTESNDALFGEFSWMVAITEDGKYRCGGSLIHESVVLTAAHCVKKDKSVYSIRAGEWDSGSTVETLKHQDRTVESIKVHENFNPKNYRNDIALVFVNQPFDLAAHVNVACLIPANEVVANGNRCYATGWGKSRFGAKEQIIPILKKVDLPIVERNTCQEQLRKTRLGPYFNLHESFVCAGGEKDKDTCTGDGGGPLVCQIGNLDNRYQQVGITAWGIGCNEQDIPGVYSNVANLREWIDKQMKDKGFGVQGYQHNAD